MDNSELKLLNITKSYGSRMVLQNINFSVERGKILCLLGPSGSGKTTILRIIAGLDLDFKGDVYIRGRSQKGVPAWERNIGFVFQTTEAVFPHLTVFQNIAFPLKLRIRKHRLQHAVDEVNKIILQIGLAPHRGTYPAKLSGGEKQRVALARALIYEPSLLLLDEPLTFLDASLKRDFLEMILQMKSKLDLTVIYVSHDEREVLQIADDVAILNRGNILQMGPVSRIIHDPNSAAVARLIGGWNVVRRQRENDREENLMSWNRIIGIVAKELPVGAQIDLGIPISAIRIEPTVDGQLGTACIRLKGHIDRLMPWYGQRLAAVDCDGSKVMVELKETSPPLSVNDLVELTVPISAVRGWTAP